MTTPEQHPTPQSNASYPPPPRGWVGPPPPPPRRRRPVLVGVAAAVTGAVVGAGLAAPVAWIAAEQTVASAPVDDQLIEGSGEDGPERAQPDWGDDETPGFPGAAAPAPFEDATAEESAGVVLIEVASGRGEGAGTGWVVDDSGLVVTNYHVVSGSNEVRATDAASGESYDATVVGHDAEADVALLQLEDASDLTEVTLDDDGDPAVGDEVTAVGNAVGQGHLSASDGAVVGLDEDIRTTNPVTGTTSPLSGLIQTDARVVQGFSGGVMIDEEGEVVGVTTAASAGGTAESYAVPVEDALAVVDQIRAEDESGSVQIGPGAHLGVSVAGTGPVEVQEVQSGGAAAEAGITAGSVLTGLDGKRVTDFASLESILAELEPGDSAPITWTDPSGAEQRASVTLGESPQN